MTNLLELEAALARAGQRTGTPLVRALIAEYLAFSYTRSKAERLLQRHVGAAGLLQPLTNVQVRSLEVDALWRQHRVIAEIDGGRSR